MEAAWAPRLRKLLKTCCGSAAIMGHNTTLSETQAREKGGTSKLPNGPPWTLYWGSGVGGHVQDWRCWFVSGVCWFCFQGLSL